VVIVAPAAGVDMHDTRVDIDLPVLECLTGRHKHQLSIGRAAKPHHNPDRRQAIQIGR
jgi:hypothetical protein